MRVGITLKSHPACPGLLKFCELLLNEIDIFWCRHRVSACHDDLLVVKGRGMRSFNIDIVSFISAWGTWSSMPSPALPFTTRSWQCAGHRVLPHLQPTLNHLASWLVITAAYRVAWECLHRLCAIGRGFRQRWGRTAAAKYVT